MNYERKVHAFTFIFRNSWSYALEDHKAKEAINFANAYRNFQQSSFLFLPINFQSSQREEALKEHHHICYLKLKSLLEQNHRGHSIEVRVNPYYGILSRIAYCFCNFNSIERIHEHHIKIGGLADLQYSILKEDRYHDDKRGLLVHSFAMGFLVCH